MAQTEPKTPLCPTCGKPMTPKFKPVLDSELPTLICFPCELAKAKKRPVVT